MSPVQKRIKDIEALIEAEKTSDNPSRNYIDDCRLTLKFLRNQLKFHETNPDGFIKVEGVKV